VSPRGWKERVQDILDAIEEIQTFTKGLDYESFKSDFKTIRAVELDFIIIGEAVNQIPEEIQDAHPQVPWHFMRGMRNRLVHVYFSVDPRLLWDTVQNDLPNITRSLRALLTK
jgi:uncharacterized protein with HEPN domain